MGGRKNLLIILFFLLSNVLNAVLLLSAVRLFSIHKNDEYEREKRFFKYTILYLFLYFGFLVISNFLKIFGADIPLNCQPLLLAVVISRARDC